MNFRMTLFFKELIIKLFVVVEPVSSLRGGLSYRHNVYVWRYGKQGCWVGSRFDGWEILVEQGGDPCCEGGERNSLSRGVVSLSILRQHGGGGALVQTEPLLKLLGGGVWNYGYPVLW